MSDVPRTVEVPAEVRSEGRRLVGHAAIFESPSNDLGGFTETIARGAFDRVLAAGPDVVLNLNHGDDHVLARTTSGTLRLRTDERGLAFEADLPDSPLGENVREAVRRRDLTGASFRFRVEPDGESWAGDVRTLTAIHELLDVSLATRPAYAGALVELRTEPKAEEARMDSTTEAPAPTEAPSTTPPETPPLPPAAEVRQAPSGGLRVEDRVGGAVESRTLLGSFKRAGWQPGARTAIAWGEFERAAESRALTWTGSVDAVNQLDRAGVPLGADARYAWPAFPRVPIDAGVTSVAVLTQTARTLPTASTVIRAIDAVTNKPEAASTLTVVPTAVKQVAAVQTGIPNVMLEQAQIEQVVGQDLRLSINEALDKLVLDAIAGSAFQAPGTDALLVSIRKAMTTIYSAGYNPNLLVLTPAASEALDVLQTAGSEALYVFGAGRFAPGQLFGMDVRVSKSIAAPSVVDAAALGRLYVSPISLASFEENAGRTNTTLVRMEGHAVFGVERPAAAVRIAAS